MLDSAIVETVVGLLFLFYATALVCSGAVEMFANWTKKRAKYLLRGLRELLDDPGESRPNVSPAIKMGPADVAVVPGPGPSATSAPAAQASTTGSSATQVPAAQASATGSSETQAPVGEPSATQAAATPAELTEVSARAQVMSMVPAAAPGDEAAHYAVALGQHLRDERAEARLEQLWSTKLIKHPLLRPYKHYNRLGEPTRNPAYLPPSAFAIALLDLMVTQPAAQDASETPAPSNLERVIGVLRRDTKDRPEKLQESLESWFNGQMDRVTGSYKRWAKRLAIPVAVVVALFFNLDTVAVARSLYRRCHPKCRARCGGRGQPLSIARRQVGPNSVRDLDGRRAQRARASGRLVQTAPRGGAEDDLLAGAQQAVRAVADRRRRVSRRTLLVRPAEPLRLPAQRRHQADARLVTRRQYSRNEALSWFRTVIKC
jgi:hypothetical protein